MPDVEPYTVKQADELVRLAVHRSRERHDLWLKLENLFRSGSVDGPEAEQIVEKVPDLTLDRINYVLPHATMVLATIAGEDPDLKVEPWESGGDPQQAEAGAQKSEWILNYFWKRTGALEKLHEAAQDAVTLGNGFLKVGWHKEEREQERDPVDQEEDLVEMLEQDRRLADLARREPRDPDELAEYVDTTTIITEADEPWVEYVSPYDIFVPHDARRLDEARWVAHRVRLPLDEVRNNEAYDEQARENLSQFVEYDGGWINDVRHRDDRMEGPYHNGGVTNDEGDDALAEVVLIEFYDMRARKMLIFEPSSQEPLYEGPLPFSHRYPPFTHLRMHNDGGSRFWAFGILENIAPIQTQFNDIYADLMDNLKRQGNKYAIDQNILTDEVRSALESNNSEEVVPINTGNQPMTDYIMPMPRQGVPQDFYAGREDLRVAMIDQLGLNDFQTGGSGADRMSGTAAAIMDGTASMRASQPRKQVEKAATRVGTLIVLLCQEFLDPERSVRIGGDSQRWVDIHREELVGEYHVNVSAGSIESVNPSAREQQAMEKMQILPALLMNLGYDPYPILRELVRDLGHDPQGMLKELPQVPGGPGEEQPAPQGGGSQSGPPPDGPGGSTQQSQRPGGPQVRQQQERGAPAL